MSARHRAISPARPPSSASLDRAAPGVSMIVSRGRPISAARLIPRRASRRLSGPSGRPSRGKRRSCPTTTHGATELGHGQDETAAALPLLGSAQDRDRVRSSAQEFLHPGTFGPAGVLDRLPRRDVVDRLVRRRLRGGNFAGHRAHHVERPCHYFREVRRHEHGVDEAQAIEVLGHLDPFGEGSSVERLVNPRPEEPDQRSRLCSGQLPRDPHEANTPPVVGWRRYTR